jgi:pilus assembly protein CpaB
MSEQPRPERSLNVPVIVAGAIVAVLGFAASVYLGTQGHVGSLPTKQIVVAAHDLDARTVLAAGDVMLASYYTADVPTGAYTKTSEVAGKVVEVSVKSGQPLLSNQLGTAASVLPLARGEVAATVPTGELVGVAGFIKPGDYIDVIAVVPSRSGGFANVRTIYSGVHVIRTGAGSGDIPGQATSLTLAVSECQAEFISWFVANASLKYSLLSAADYAAAAQATPDNSCPAKSKGVSDTDVKSRWPGLLP